MDQETDGSTGQVYTYYVASHYTYWNMSIIFESKASSAAAISVRFCRKNTPNVARMCTVRALAPNTLKASIYGLGRCLAFQIIITFS